MRKTGKRPARVLSSKGKARSQKTGRDPKPSGSRSLVERATKICKLVTAAASAGIALTKLYIVLWPLVEASGGYLIPEGFWYDGLHKAHGQRQASGVRLLKARIAVVNSDRACLVAKVAAFSPKGRRELAQSLEALEVVVRVLNRAPSRAAAA